MIRFNGFTYMSWDIVRYWWKLYGRRGTATGYSTAPNLIRQQVEGPGFVIYPPGHPLPEEACIRMNVSSGSPVYGNSYCATLNPF